MRTGPDSFPSRPHDAPPPVLGTSRGGSAALALLRTARPRQWAKNVLVLSAPAAAGKLFDSDVLGPTSVAFIAFCFAASGTYMLNDVLDRERDRLHPTKRERPIASGSVHPALAGIVGVVLLVIAIAMSIRVNDGALAATVAGYVTLTLAYSFWLKHQPVVELTAVAAGFVIRAIAGGSATGIEISDWFLIVASFGALFIVTGKRHAELLDLAHDAAAHRQVLAAYTPSFLTYVRSVTSAACITAYCLWALEKAAAVTNGTDYWFTLSIVPFVLAILQYALVIEQGKGGAPEEVILGDRRLQVLGVVWAAVFGIGLAVS